MVASNDHVRMTKMVEVNQDGLAGVVVLRVYEAPVVARLVMIVSSGLYRQSP